MEAEKNIKTKKQIHHYKKKPNGKNATGRPETYTKKLQYCLKEIHFLYNRLMDKNSKHITLHDLIRDREYPREYISLWVEKFKDNDEFCNTYKKIYCELENRLYKYGLTGKAAAVVIFGLVNNYGWKNEHKIQHAGEIKTGQQITDEEFAERLRRAQQILSNDNP
jgi:hypothetical protein